MSATQKAVDVSAFIKEQKRLIEDERSTEIAEEKVYRSSYSERELERAGLCLMRLSVSDSSSGLYGRLLITFESSRGGPLKPSKFSVRDLVQLIASGSHTTSTTTTASGSSAGDNKSGGSGSGADKKDRAVTGIVYRMRDTSITVAFDSDPDSITERTGTGGTGLVSLIKLTNEVTYQRYSAALSAVEKAMTATSGSGGVSSHPLIPILFGHELPRVHANYKPADSGDGKRQWNAYDNSLNSTQLSAIDFCLYGARDVALIHGPPGTGKTTTVVELIRQIVAPTTAGAGAKNNRGGRVLACAPSNVAVDNLVLRLGRAGVRVVRLGHPARVSDSSLLKYSLDSQVRSSEQNKLANDIRTEMSGLMRTLAKPNSKVDRAERYQIRSSLKQLRTELRTRERLAVTSVLEHAQVVVCTNTVAADKRLDARPAGLTNSGDGQTLPFDVCVIDEAGQALEASCWIPILRARKLILAGDHMQLPPTIKSASAAAGGLSATLFDRLLGADHTSHSATVKASGGKADSKSAKSKPTPTATPTSGGSGGGGGGAGIASEMLQMLTVQYRMNEKIMRWCSAEFYDSKLVCGTPDISKQLLRDMPHVHTTDDTALPVVMIDTAGCGFEEDPKSTSLTGENESTSNTGEVGVVIQHIKQLLSAGVRAPEIGVITPYNAQVASIRDALLTLSTTASDSKQPSFLDAAGVEVSSADGFQGREKEAIIISMVRSNAKAEIGFLREKRRMNVAVSRAKRHLCIICDSATVSSDPVLKRLITYCQSDESGGEYRSAAEYLDPNWGGSDAQSQTIAVATTATAAAGDTKSAPGSAIVPTAIVASPEVDAKTKAEQKAAVIAMAEAARKRREDAIAAKAASAKAKSARTDVSLSRELKDTLLPATLDDATIRTILTDLIDRGQASKYVTPAAAAAAAAAGGAAPAQPWVDFPAALNSYQRRAVHEIADTLWPALSHDSIGEGANRFIRCILLSPDEQKSRREQRRSEQQQTVDAAAVLTDTKTPSVKPAEPAPTAQPAAADTKKSKNKNKKKKTGGAVPIVAAPPVIQGTSTSEEEKKRLQRLGALSKRLGGSGSGGSGGSGGAGTKDLLTADERAKYEADQKQSAATAAATDAVMAALDAMGGGCGFRPMPKINQFSALEDEATLSVSEPATKPAPAPALAATASDSNVDSKHTAPVAASDAAANTASDAAPATKSKNKKKKGKASAAAAGGGGGGGDGDDLDSILSEFRVGRCKQTGCKESIQFTGFTCEFCKEQYCVNHMNPVFHGCAAAHRDKARDDMAKRARDQKIRNASTPASNDTPAKKLSASDKMYLAQKLHKATDRKQSETVGKKAAKKAAEKKK